MRPVVIVSRWLVVALGASLVWSGAPAPLLTTLLGTGSVALSWASAWALAGIGLVGLVEARHEGSPEAWLGPVAALLGGLGLLLVHNLPLLAGAILALPASARAGGAVVTAAAFGLRTTSHVAYLFALGGLVVGATQIGRVALARGGSPGAPGPALQRAALVLGSVFFTLILTESLLLALDRLSPGEARARIPEHLDYRPAPEERGYYWHGKLHDLNREGFRGKDWPPPSPERYRIIALGDSLTYGYGVGFEETWAAGLEARLSDRYRVEVLNLGVSGYQSEDILRVAQERLSPLDARLVVYGHCLNDFLPSGTGEYRSNDRLAIPLPEPWKRSFARQTSTGAFLERKYDQLLMKLGVRDDFFADILKDFRSYVSRFSADVTGLNRFVTSSGLPPVVSLVLNQYPTEERGREISRLAERQMAAAGMIVIPSMPYQERLAHEGARLDVSPWEGHPNAEAHRLFAQTLAEGILSDPRLVRELEPFARDRSPASGTPSPGGDAQG